VASDKDIFLKVLDENAKACRCQIRKQHAAAITKAQLAVTTAELGAKQAARFAIEKALSKWGGKLDCNIVVGLDAYGSIKLDRAKFPALAKADRALKAAQTMQDLDEQAVNDSAANMRRHVAVYGVDKKLTAMFEGMVSIYGTK
jgi:hypothetical protein